MRAKNDWTGVRICVYLTSNELVKYLPQEQKGVTYIHCVCSSPGLQFHRRQSLCNRMQ